MSTLWQRVEAWGIAAIPGLPGVRLEVLPVFNDARGSVHELYRQDEIPPEFKPAMACCSWSQPGVTRGPHQHAMQDDYFVFAGPSDFRVYLWDSRPGSAGQAKGWFLDVGQGCPARLFVPVGVVHAYRNIGSDCGMVVTIASVLYKGEGRRGPVDEIRHELNPASPYQLPEL